MGCSCSREEMKVIVSNQIHPKNKFVIKITIPFSNKSKLLTHEEDTDYMTISDLLNLIFFSGRWADEMDANFIARYNKTKEEFDYFIQRLAGYELEQADDPLEGKLWCVYINKKKENLNSLFGMNRIVNKKDEIELKYENF